MIKKFTRIRLAVFTAALAAGLTLGLAPAWTGAALAQMKSQSAPRGPVNITADKLSASDAEGQVVFTGQVMARQGDLTINCETMRVFYSAAQEARPKAGADGENAGPDVSARPGEDQADDGRAGLGVLNPAQPGAGRDIDRVECEGKVRIVQGDRLAVGQKAVYLAKSLPRRIILTGEARMWQGQDSISGHQITYDLDQGRGLVEGGAQKGRVRATYNQGAKPKEGANE